jgi:hypothetical protein
MYCIMRKSRFLDAVLRLIRCLRGANFYLTSAPMFLVLSAQHSVRSALLSGQKPQLIEHVTTNHFNVLFSTPPNANDEDAHTLVIIATPQSHGRFISPSLDPCKDDARDTNRRQ